MKCDSGDDEVPGYYSGGDVEVDNGRLRIEVEQLRAEVANLRHYRESDLAERERHVERIGFLEKRLAVEMGALAALTDATATYDHEIVKAAYRWSQAHDGIDGGLDEAKQALFEAVERRRAATEGVEPVTIYRARPA